METVSTRRTIFGEFTAVEFVSLIFIGSLAILVTIFYSRVDLIIVLSNLSVSILIIFFCNWLSFTSKATWVRVLHSFYIIPIVIYLFKVIEYVSLPIHGHDYDSVLISIDRWMFGADPTVWLYHHIPVIPLFIEVLQICYCSYYTLPVIVAIELFIRHSKNPNDHRSSNDLEMLRFVIVYGFLLSYIGYLLVPAVGPRFMLHEFANHESELPGIWLSDKIRWFINAGENIVAGMTSAEAISVVSRDAFPSGHTEMTLLSILLAFRFKVRSRWIILCLGCGLFFSTIYLHYHYVIDVIAGVVAAMIALYTAKPVIAFFQSVKIRIVNSGTTNAR